MQPDCLLESPVPANSESVIRFEMGQVLVCVFRVKIAAGAINYGQFMCARLADFRCILLIKHSILLCVQSIIQLENAYIILVVVVD